MTPPRDIKACLAQDDLTGALEIAGEAVRRSPQNLSARLLLIELLVLDGDLERADKQVVAATTLAPAEAVGLGLLRAEIAGMHARARWYEEAALPGFPGGATPLDEAALKLALASRAGDQAGLNDARAALDAAEPAILAWNEQAPTPLRDLDDRLPHALEVVSQGGAYLWVDLRKIARLDIAPLSRPRDLAFRRAQLILRDGAQAAVLLPMLYHGDATTRPALRLGRETDWIEGPDGLVTGIGQRCLLAGEEMRALAETKTLGLDEGGDG